MNKSKPASFAPQGPGSPTTAKTMARPQSPGGAGFLINPSAFTDARPPAARGMKKSLGYPNFSK